MNMFPQSLWVVLVGNCSSRVSDYMAAYTGRHSYFTYWKGGGEGASLY